MIESKDQETAQDAHNFGARFKSASLKPFSFLFKPFVMPCAELQRSPRACGIRALCLAITFEPAEHRSPVRITLPLAFESKRLNSKRVEIDCFRRGCKPRYERNSESPNEKATAAAEAAKAGGYG